MTRPLAPRLVPDWPLPAYSYVTGHFPHPTRDPAGHSFGHAAPRPAAVDPDRWPESREYLAALDLFNHGYYWEAHEVWESLWHASGRRGTVADFLKCLIKLAAAGVKAREGRTAGVTMHARRASELFAITRELVGQAAFLGLDLDGLIATANHLVQEPVVARRPTANVEGRAKDVPPVEIVFDFALVPSAR